MKTITTQLKNSLSQDTATLATCWKIKRVDGKVYGFTSADVDVTFEGVVYAASTGYTPSSIESSSGMAVDNLEVEGIINLPDFEEYALAGGLFDYAEVEVFLLDYVNPGYGKLILRSGILGEISTTNTTYSAEIRGLLQYLQQPIGNIYQSSCRTQFCSNKCKLSAVTYTKSATILTISDDGLNITADEIDAEDDVYTYGLLTMTSGEAIGLQAEVRIYKDMTISLQLPTVIRPVVGDTFSIIEGCDKTLSTCKTRFNNVINFRGEPYIPGLSKLIGGV